MQTEAPDVFDVSKESKATLDMYGPGSTALGCLISARLAEKGVRMVQTYYGKGDPWDAHNDILTYKKLAKDSDQGYAALIKDLKQRGLFEDTLVVGGRSSAARRRSKRQRECRWVVSGRDPTRPASRSGWPAAASRGRLTGHRRLRVQGGGEEGPRHDLRDDAVSARHRSHEADVPLQRARLPSDRHRRRSDPRHHRVKAPCGRDRSAERQTRPRCRVSPAGCCLSQRSAATCTRPASGAWPARRERVTPTLTQQEQIVKAFTPAPVVSDVAYRVVFKQIFPRILDAFASISRR
jgi:hypothetical protein